MENFCYWLENNKKEIKNNRIRVIYRSHPSLCILSGNIFQVGW
jgi:hypothetical protein